MKQKHLQLMLSVILISWHFIVLSQNDNSIPTSENLSSTSGLTIGLNGSVDLPLISLADVNLLEYNLGYKAGVFADYYFGKLGVGLDVDYFKNGVGTSIPSTIYYGTQGSATSLTNVALGRINIGIGPNYRFLNTSKLRAELNTRVGISNITGGDLLVESKSPITSGITDTHVMSTGYLSKLTPTAKAQLKATYYISSNIGMSLGLYYIRHFSTHLDPSFDIGSTSNPSIFYGENNFDETGANPFTLASTPPTVVPITNNEESYCHDIASAGATIGLSYHFGNTTPRTKNTTPAQGVCSDCECPNDGHKVMITVRDQASGKVIPNADVALKDKQNRIVATGTTNSYGVVDLGELPHGSYKVEGNVFGLPTSVLTIDDVEFIPNAIIQKEIFYTDLRFILKGKVVNKTNRSAEPNVVVSLTNQSNKSVVQESSDGLGAFAFRLDKSSTYEVVGIKKNRLSDVARASTVGLNRSTTLFVDLELGVEDFECDRGRVLDIKYEFDKDALLPESMFDLDKLVRYMQAHKKSNVELSSHTDSRGSNEYNQDLSQRRAQSAVDYIMSKGVRKSRIIARGYGETQLTNRCADGVSCSESEHRVNRRTEAKLLCN